MTATTPLRELLPGPWYAVLGARALVLLPPEEKRRVPAVWDRVDEGAGFDEVLDALISDGLRDLSGFALASFVGSVVITALILYRAARAMAFSPTAAQLRTVPAHVSSDGQPLAA